MGLPCRCARPWFGVKDCSLPGTCDLGSWCSKGAVKLDLPGSPSQLLCVAFSNEGVWVGPRLRGFPPHTSLPRQLQFWAHQLGSGLKRANHLDVKARFTQDEGARPAKRKA